MMIIHGFTLFAFPFGTLCGLWWWIVSELKLLKRDVETVETVIETFETLDIQPVTEYLEFDNVFIFEVKNAIEDVTKKHVRERPRISKPIQWISPEG